MIPSSYRILMLTILIQLIRLPSGPRGFLQSSPPHEQNIQRLHRSFRILYLLFCLRHHQYPLNSLLAQLILGGIRVASA